jgi:hypothetical protein
MVKTDRYTIAWQIEECKDMHFDVEAIVMGRDGTLHKMPRIEIPHTTLNSAVLSIARWISQVNSHYKDNLQIVPDDDYPWFTDAVREVLKEIVEIQDDIPFVNLETLSKTAEVSLKKMFERDVVGLNWNTHVLSRKALTNARHAIWLQAKIRGRPISF